MLSESHLNANVSPTKHDSCVRISNIDTTAIQMQQHFAFGDRTTTETGLASTEVASDYTILCEQCRIGESGCLPSVCKRLLAKSMRRRATPPSPQTAMMLCGLMSLWLLSSCRSSRTCSMAHAHVKHTLRQMFMQACNAQASRRCWQQAGSQSGTQHTIAEA